MLKNKRILITAGPTWVAIDKIRVVSNVSTGEAGILIAEEAAKAGARVTLLLGPTQKSPKNKSIEVIRYCFFDELKKWLQKLLKSGKFAALIHAAAVSDYKPKDKFKPKLESGIKNLKLRLVPTEKLIDKFKLINPGIFLVGFKLESAAPEVKLIRAAARLFKSAKADLLVANTLDSGIYRGIILDQEKNILARLSSRKELAAKLIRLLKEKI